MPRLDKQLRIAIPADLCRKSSLIPSTEIAICYNDSTHSLDICNKQNCTGKMVIAYRKLGGTRRFNLPLDAILLLGATPEDQFIFTLTDEQISIVKV